MAKIKWLKVLIFVLVIFAIWLPRSLELDRFVTPDETKWLIRSANFYQALSSGDFASTYQKGHPGVTVMWVGTLGYLSSFRSYTDLDPGQRSKPQKFLRLLDRYGHAPMVILAACRKIIVLVNLLVLALAYLCAIRLVGFYPASLGFLFIAFDPFAVALSRLLHPDGFVGPFMLLSLLAMMNYFYRGGRRLDLLLSAAAAGLSWLTKSPALFLLPFFGLLALFEVRKYGIQALNPLHGDFWKLARPVIAWAGVAALVFVLLWPAMWVAPLTSVMNVLGQATTYAEEGHKTPLFFNGQVYSAGIWDWRFYPINYLWRTTPVVLLGLVFAGVAMLFRRKLKVSDRHWIAMAILSLFALLFTIFMTLGGKKFDRYLLPVFAPLDLVAALGWIVVLQAGFQSNFASRLFGGRAQQVARYAVPVVVLGGVLLQLITVVQTRPYYFSYYNPLLGGAEKAPEVMMIGWGEGLDQAARYLNAKPGADQIIAQAWYEEIFPYIFDGKTIQKKLNDEPDDIQKADYYVLYIHQWQRQLPSQKTLQYFANLQPEYVVRINGIDYAKVYSRESLLAGSQDGATPQAPPGTSP